MSRPTQAWSLRGAKVGAAFPPVEQGGQDIRFQAQLGPTPLRLIQKRKALSAEQQPLHLGPCRTDQVQQRRRHNCPCLEPIVEAAFGREELEGRSGLLPGHLGGHRLIPEPLGLTPQAVRWWGVARSRFPLPTQSAQLLLCRLGAFQGACGRALGSPPTMASLAERVKDVQLIL